MGAEEGEGWWGGGGRGKSRGWWGHFPTDAALLAWVRCGVEFLPAAILGHPVFVRILALFPFLPFPAVLPSSYLEFRISVRFA